MIPKPIIFSTPMVEAWLAGRKRATRRVVKVPKGPAYEGADLTKAWPDNTSPFGPCLKVPCAEETVQRIFCAYGEAGQHLYVKEAHYRWGLWSVVGHTKAGRPLWRSFPLKRKGEARIVFALPPGEGLAGREEVGWHTGSPLYLPKRHSRLHLELESARFHRLQDMNETDILNEGVTVDRVAAQCNVPWSEMPSLHAAWRVLWNHINGDTPGHSWEDDPWVVAMTLNPVAEGT